MIEQTTAFLGDLLPSTDVTEVEVSTSQAMHVDELARVRDFHERATPPTKSTASERTFVIVPDTDSGKAFARLVKEAIPSAFTIPVPGAATDMMFCRERGCLPPSELMSLLQGCLPAYYEALASPHSSPHARFDVMEWIPLNE